MTMNRSRGASYYNQVGVQTSVMSANPHRLVQMLLEGALGRIAAAKGHIEANRVAEKCTQIGQAIAIVDGLRVSLDREKGGEIAENLNALYDYIMRRLLEANSRNSIEMLDEVAGLLREVKAGWDNIPKEYQQGFTVQQAIG